MCENSCRDDLRHVFALLGRTFSCVFCLGFNFILFFFFYVRWRSLSFFAAATPSLQGIGPTQ